ncbi:MAG: flagellin lysine-N-methylase [Shewanella sp.]
MAIKHLTPNFYKNFQCIGSQCEDDCCHGWTISIDKKTFTAYEKHTNQELRLKAKENIKKVKKSHGHWGEIQFKENGACKFLQDDGLCFIHRVAGGEALSSTCKTYPRMTIDKGNEIRHTLSLSCPEVSRQVLLDPSAMLLSITERKGHAVAKTPNNANTFLQQLACHIIENHALSIEVRLWIIGMLVHRDDSKLSHIDFINQLAEIDERDGLETHFLALTKNHTLHWWALRALSNVLLGSTNKNRRGYGPMSQCLDAIFNFFSQDSDGNKIEELYYEWQQKWQPWLATRPHILNNYLRYWVYHQDFPSENEPAQNSYQLLVADFFLLRAYLCALTIAGAEPSEQLMIGLFYSYHSQRLHNSTFADAVRNSLNQSNLNSDAAIYSMLKL